MHVNGSHIHEAWFGKSHESLGHWYCTVQYSTLQYCILSSMSVRVLTSRIALCYPRLNSRAACWELDSVQRRPTHFPFLPPDFFGGSRCRIARPFSCSRAVHPSRFTGATVTAIVVVTSMPGTPKITLELPREMFNHDDLEVNLAFTWTLGLSHPRGAARAYAVPLGQGLLSWTRSQAYNAARWGIVVRYLALRLDSI